MQFQSIVLARLAMVSPEPQVLQEYSAEEYLPAQPLKTLCPEA